MKSFIIDCSIAMAWCFEDESTQKTDQLLYLLKEQEGLVPSIWLLEIANVLRMAEEKNRISSEHSISFYQLLTSLPIRIVSNASLVYSEQCLKLARDYRLTAYDAAYLELALRYKSVSLASLDRALCAAAIKAGIVLL